MTETLDGTIEKELIQSIKDMMNAYRNNDSKKSIKIAQDIKKVMDVHIECQIMQEGIPYKPIEYTGEKLKGTDLKIYRIKEDK